MSGNPLPPTMLQMPWLALSLVLVWTTVTLCSTPCHEKNFDKPQRVQNRAARIVCGVGRRQQSARQLRHSLHTGYQFEQELASSWRY